MGYIMDYFDKVVSGINKMDYEQFMNLEDELSSIDEDMMRAWHLRSFHWQMIDVWSSVDIAKWLWKRWQKTNEDSDYRLFIDKMREVHTLCCIVRADPCNSTGARRELRMAEWILYDFFFWDNKFQESIDTVSKWFDERRYAINYDLLKDEKRDYSKIPY